jgi:hypothetical protein
MLVAVGSLPGITCGSGAAGDDGNFYFLCSQGQTRVLAAIAQKNYAVTIIPLPTKLRGLDDISYSGPIAFQSGNIWIGGNTGDSKAVWEFSPSGSMVAYYAGGRASDILTDIAAGPGGTLWVTALKNRVAPYILAISH